MRVAIDIRRAGDYGLGTYIINIVNQLARLDQDTQYLLIGQKRHVAEFDPLPQNFQPSSNTGTIQAACIRTCSCPGSCAKPTWIVLHMPWFYAPAMVPARLVLTVHDLSDVLTPPVGASPPVQTGRLFFARRALRRADPITTSALSRTFQAHL